MYWRQSLRGYAALRRTGFCEQRNRVWFLRQLVEQHAFRRRHRVIMPVGRTAIRTIAARKGPGYDASYLVRSLAVIRAGRSGVAPRGLGPGARVLLQLLLETTQVLLVAAPGGRRFRGCLKS